MKYVTKNKTEVINLLKVNSDKHLSIDDIFEMLDKKVPLASLYRIIDQLEEEGMVIKFIIDKNMPACFQYVGDGLTHSHFHMICTKCGRLFHLECDNVEKLIGHISEHHGFKVDVTKVNLYGVCEECQKREL